jgi:hypothetical protein
MIGKRRLTIITIDRCRATIVLDNVQQRVGREQFFSCLWQSVVGSSRVRLAALIYVNSRYDRKKSMDDQLFIMGTQVDHMVE